MRESIENIYTQYKDLVYYYINIKLKNSAIAEEITQEVFLKVYKSIHSYRGEASIKNWILSITRNEIVSYLRKHEKFKTSQYTDSYDKVNNNRDENPELYIDDREDTRYIFEILDKLNEDQKNAIILHDIKQLSYKEIADRLNWSLSKVKITIYRARIKFKKLYGGAIDGM
ncbi:RNA polymerase sigma factor [Clostridiaceae bacterium M8S5]|nr:RNA polymerase sigma factor [Clostridiaceae bacterium M8S5]